MKKQKYMKPSLDDLLNAGFPVAEGTQCINGDYYQAGTCSTGDWAGVACSSGTYYTTNRCYAGPTNLPSSP